MSSVLPVDGPSYISGCLPIGLKLQARVSRKSARASPAWARDLQQEPDKSEKRHSRRPAHTQVPRAFSGFSLDLKKTKRPPTRTRRSLARRPYLLVAFISGESVPVTTANLSASI
jgi:hypothetical protein